MNKVPINSEPTLFESKVDVIEFLKASKRLGIALIVMSLGFAIFLCLKAPQLGAFRIAMPAGMFLACCGFALFLRYVYTHYSVRVTKSAIHLTNGGSATLSVPRNTVQNLRIETITISGSPSRIVRFNTPKRQYTLCLEKPDEFLAILRGDKHSEGIKSHSESIATDNWLTKQVDLHPFFGPWVRGAKWPRISIYLIVGLSVLSLAFDHSKQSVHNVIKILVFSTVALKASHRRTAISAWFTSKVLFAMVGIFLVLGFGPALLAKGDSGGWVFLLLGLLWLPGPEFFPAFFNRQSLLMGGRFFLTVPLLFLIIHNGLWNRLQDEIKSKSQASLSRSSPTAPSRISREKIFSDCTTQIKNKHTSVAQSDAEAFCSCAADMMVERFPASRETEISKDQIREVRMQCKERLNLK